jgi:hypothetical protein
MKALLSFSFVFLLCFIAGAQENQFARHLIDSRPTEIACINSKCYHLEGTNPGGGDFESLNLVGTSSSGTEMFKLPLFGGYKLYETILRVTPGKELLVYATYWLKYCDVGGTQYSLTLVDTSGTSVFNLTTSSIAGIVDAFGGSDGNIYAVTGTNLIKISHTGSVLASTSLGITGIKSITPLANGRYLINYLQGSPPRNRMLDSVFQFMYEMDACTTFRKVRQSTSGSYFAMAGNDVLKMANDWTYISTSQTILPSATGVADFDLRNDSLFMTGHVSEVPFLVVSDTNFNILSQSASTCTNVIPTGITLNGKTNIVARTNKMQGSGILASYPVLFKINPGKNLNPQFDIGVTSISVNSLSVNDFTSSPLSTYKVRTMTAELAVTVKNFGPDTVRNFTVKMNSAGVFGFCYADWSFYKHYQNQIPPFGNIVVNTGAFYTQSLVLQVGQDQSFCLYTTVPNEKIDEQQSNDEFCMSTPVGISENIASQPIIHIYPTPAGSEITVVTAGNIRNIRLMDSMGKIVLEESPLFSETKLNLETFQAGLYFIQIKTDTGIQIQKLVRR